MWVLPLGLSQAEENEAGQLAFQQNCMACHLVDTQVVGPSLVAVAMTYPKDKQAEFVAWAQNPGKKNPRLLQMPPMAHVPEATLAQIHRYILTATEGKTESRSRPKFPSFEEPERPLPYVVRAFLPEASPASVAVVLPGDVSLCWDTEACRFRYAWTGSKTRLRQGHTVVKLEEAPFYRETSEQLWSISEGEKPKFRGYRLRSDGSPEFAFAIGDVEVREHIAAGDKAGSFTRHFTLSEPLERLQLNLGPDTDASYAADKGVLESGILTLTGAETKSFTLTVSQP